MKKAVFMKATLCVGATAILLCGSRVPMTTAAAIASETGMAGISLALDRYYTQSMNPENSNVSGTASLFNLENEKPIGPIADVGNIPEVAATPEPTATPEPEPTVAPTPEPVSEYANTGISVADNYVHVRKEPNTESEILGKLYRGSAATIIETEGEWVKIKSGRVQGYIKSEFLAIGFDAEELVDRYGTKWAVVNTTTLFVREKATTDSACLTMIPLGEKFEVLEILDGWVKILIDEGNEGEESTEGYVSADYVNIEVEFEHAISIEEEQEELRRAEEARKAEEEQARKLEEAKRLEAERQQQQNQQQKPSSNSSSNSNSANSSSSNRSSGSSSKSSSSSGSTAPKQENNNKPLVTGTGTGADIAAYAQKFVGYPYRYGGTSLTNGADCSGFVQSVYKSFNISLPRTSSAQSTAGTKVSLDALQPGDLIFYASNGRVGHVAIYIGGGRVVHASNKKTGIKTSNYNYRTPYSARRIVR